MTKLFVRLAQGQEIMDTYCYTVIIAKYTNRTGPLAAAARYVCTISVSACLFKCCRKLTNILV